MSQVRREAFRFVLVGGAASLTHIAVGLGLATVLVWRPWVANIFAFLTALGVSYLGNSLFTFQVEARRADAFARFFAVSAVAFAVNQGLVWTLTTQAHWPYWAALGVVLVIVPPMTFLLAKHWALVQRG